MKPHQKAVNSFALFLDSAGYLFMLVAAISMVAILGALTRDALPGLLAVGCLAGSVACAFNAYCCWGIAGLCRLAISAENELHIMRTTVQYQYAKTRRDDKEARDELSP